MYRLRLVPDGIGSLFSPGGFEMCFVLKNQQSFQNPIFFNGLETSGSVGAP